MSFEDQKDPADKEKLVTYELYEDPYKVLGLNRNGDRNVIIEKCVEIIDYYKAIDGIEVVELNQKEAALKAANTILNE